MVMIVESTGISQLLAGHGVACAWAAPKSMPILVTHVVVSVKSDLAQIL